MTSKSLEWVTPQAVGALVAVESRTHGKLEEIVSDISSQNVILLQRLEKNSNIEVKLS